MLASLQINSIGDKMSVEAVSSDPNTTSNSVEEKQTGSLNGREVEIQEHKENAKECLKDYLLAPVEAAAHVIVNPNYIGVVEAVKIIAENHQNLIEACKEYNEAKRIENEEKGLDPFYNPLDSGHENDRDSWDRDY